MELLLLIQLLLPSQEHWPILVRTDWITTEKRKAEICLVGEGDNTVSGGQSFLPLFLKLANHMITIIIKSTSNNLLFVLIS
jgi:hypothetical protein